MDISTSAAPARERDLDIVMIDQDPGAARRLEEELRATGLRAAVRRAETEASYRAALLAARPDAVLADERSRSLSPERARRILIETHPRVPLVVAHTDGDQVGALLAMEGVGRNITERRHAEQELRARFRQQAAVEELGGLALGNADLETLMSRTVELVAETLEVSMAAILERTEEGGLVLRSGIGWPSGWAESPDDGRPASPFTTSLRKGAPVVMADVEDRDALRLGDALAGRGRVSCAGVAIDGANHRASAILAVCDLSGRGLADSDVSFLGSTAHVVANAARRRRAEAALERRELQFRTLAENAPDLILRFDAQARILYLNPAAREVLRLPESALPGPPLDEIELPSTLPPEDAAALGKAGGQILPRLRDVLETGAMTTAELELPSSRGLRTFEATIIPERAPSGGVESMLVVSRDVTDWLRGKRKLEETVRLLRRTDEERRSLLERIVRAQEDERSRIADDIHDDSIQIMAAAELRLGLLRRGIADEGQLELLDKVEETVQRAISRLRHLMFELRPPSLDRDGLTAGIHTYLEQHREDDGPRYELDADLYEEPDLDRRAILFRIVQEAVTNARKHARASLVAIRLVESDGGYLVRVSDDGVGFSPARHHRREPGHLGLASMRERAEMMDGTFRIDSAPGTGTTIEVWVPSRMRMGGDPR